MIYPCPSRIVVTRGVVHHRVPEWPAGHSGAHSWSPIMDTYHAITHTQTLSKREKERKKERKKDILTSSKAKIGP